MTAAKIMLTGASGFLGSALSLFFKDTGYDVALLLRPGSSLKRLKGSRFEIGWCSSEKELSDFVLRVQPQAIIHTACAFGRQGETLLQLHDANVRLGLSMLQALRALPSSAQPRLFLNTGTSLSADISEYSLSKKQFAEWGRREALAAPAALQFINVQLEQMYGAGDDMTKFPMHVLHAMTPISS